VTYGRKKVPVAAKWDTMIRPKSLTTTPKLLI
jgi:hypothetical protein